MCCALERLGQEVTLELLATAASSTVLPDQNTARLSTTKGSSRRVTLIDGTEVEW